jgi:hypothetical protein
MAGSCTRLELVFILCTNMALVSSVLQRMPDLRLCRNDTDDPPMCALLPIRVPSVALSEAEGAPLLMTRGRTRSEQEDAPGEHGQGRSAYSLYTSCAF